jgi:uncharacterized protein YndB with AHSA1/START domain
MNLPRRNVRGGTRGYAHLVELEVPAPVVWRALTDPAVVRIWSGQEVEIDARQGGSYRIGKTNAGAREALIDIFDVNRRLRLIYMDSKHWPPSDSAAVDDFILDSKRGDCRTSLRLLGSGISDSADWDTPYARVRLGWERSLARIKSMLEAPPAPPKPVPKPAKVEPKDPPLPGLDY